MAPPTAATVLSLGEIVWDLYPDRRLLGGAPFNVAAHLARLGESAGLISAVGDDALGREALARAAALGVATDLTRIHPALPTGVVDVTLDARKQPAFHLRRPAAWEEPRILEVPEAAWLVCGTLQQTCPAASAVRRRLSAIPLFYDVNLRPSFEDAATVDELLHAATVVKCNEAELDWLRTAFGIRKESDLINRYSIDLVCVTLGDKGCRLVSASGELEAPAPGIEVVDTVGAGDAFAAALLHGLIQHWPLERIATFANRLGALVASRPGAVPEWSIEELQERQ